MPISHSEKFKSYILSSSINDYHIWGNMSGLQFPKPIKFSKILVFAEFSRSNNLEVINEWSNNPHLRNEKKYWERVFVFSQFVV